MYFMCYALRAGLSYARLGGIALCAIALRPAGIHKLFEGFAPGAHLEACAHDPTREVLAATVNYFHRT